MKPFSFKLLSGQTVDVETLTCGTLRAAVRDPETSCLVVSYASGQRALYFFPITGAPTLHGWLSVGETQFRVHPDDVQRVWDLVQPAREAAA